jgi:Flp pilus assembly protein TadD
VEVINGMIDAGLTEQALALCAQLRSQGITTTELDVAQARALNVQGLHTEAQQFLEQVLKKHKRDAGAWSMLGVVLADQEKLPEAKSALETANRLKANDSDVLNNLGFVAMAQGDLEEATRYYRASLQVDPTQKRTRNNLGFALVRMEQDQAGLEMFRSAGSETEARYNMGVACEWRNDRACAVVQFQAALEATPGYEPAVNALKKLLVENTP